MAYPSLILVARVLNAACRSPKSRGASSPDNRSYRRFCAQALRGRQAKPVLEHSRNGVDFWSGATDVRGAVNGSKGSMD